MDITECTLSCSASNGPWSPRRFTGPIPANDRLGGKGSLAIERDRRSGVGSRVALRTGYQAYDLHNRCAVRVRYSPELGYAGGSRCVVPREKWRWWQVQAAVSAGQAPKVWHARAPQLPVLTSTLLPPKPLPCASAPPAAGRWQSLSTCAIVQRSTTQWRR